MELMEICCAIETYIYILVYTSMMGYILYCFAKPFMMNKDKAFCVGAAYIIAMCILEVVPVILSNFATYITGILSAFLFMCWIDRRNYRQKIYIVITFFSLRWLSAYFAGTFTANLYDQMVITPYLSGIYYILALLHYGISIVTIVVVAVLFQNIKEKYEHAIK